MDRTTDEFLVTMICSKKMAVFCSLKIKELKESKSGKFKKWLV